MNRFLFYTSARLFGEACLSLCILRKTPNNEIQIYLLRRPKNDPFYPFMLHIPGTRKLPNDTDDAQLKRVIKETAIKIELQDIEYITSTTIKTARGTEFADYRLVIVPFYDNEPNFYDIYNLPNNVIKHHCLFISQLFISTNNPKRSLRI